MFENSIISYPVEKEYIDSLNFPTQEVLDSAEEIEQRRADVEKGWFLGNGYKSKVLIHFKDDEGIKSVETTIWFVTEKRVILKNNLSIPLHRIVRVKVQGESLKYPNI